MTTKNNDWEILELMEELGGGFAKHIAIAAQHADAGNYLRLKTAFPELWKDYDCLAQWGKENRAKEARAKEAN